MQKWGTNRNGSTRFRCTFCSVSTTRKRRDLSQKYKEELFQKWLLGKQSLYELSKAYGVTIRTFNNWFTSFWNVEPAPIQIHIAHQILVLDGKYVEQNASVLLATCNKKVVSWYFSQRENYSSWFTFLSSFTHIPFAIVCDGQKGMIKAIKQRFPGIIIQRCQFHVIQYCTIKLTKNPESDVAQKLRFLVLQIAKIKTKEHLRAWLTDYRYWYQTHKDFIKEKTYQSDNLTPMGRLRWHYTHGRLHATHSHLKNSLPYLFRYLQHKEIPNTTNFVEGGINALMQEKLRFHRGLSLSKRRILIAHFLSSKQR
jgi:hypothetical protein